MYAQLLRKPAEDGIVGWEDEARANGWIPPNEGPSEYEKSLVEEKQKELWAANDKIKQLQGEVDDLNARLEQLAQEMANYRLKAQQKKKGERVGSNDGDDAKRKEQQQHEADDKMRELFLKALTETSIIDDPDSNEWREKTIEELARALADADLYAADYPVSIQSAIRLANSIKEGKLQGTKAVAGEGAEAGTDSSEGADLDCASEEENADVVAEHLDVQEEWKALKAEMEDGTEQLEHALATLRTKWAGDKLAAASARIKATREIESLSAAKARLELLSAELQAELDKTKEKLRIANEELEILRQGHPVHQIFELKGFIGMEMFENATEGKGLKVLDLKKEEEGKPGSGSPAFYAGLQPQDDYIISVLDNPPLQSEKQFGAQIRGFTPGDKIRCQVYNQSTDSRREVVIEVGAVGIDPEIVRKLRERAGLNDVEIWARPENWELLPNCFLQVSQQQQVLKLMREVKEAKAEVDKLRQEKDFAEESEKLAREYAENTKDFVDNLKKKRQEEYEREKEAARKRAEAYMKLVKGEDGTVRREGDVSAIDRLDVPDGIIDYPTARKPLTDFKGWLQKCASHLQAFVGHGA